MDKTSKKALREKARAMRPEMGVYAFVCTASGKSYIGSTAELKGTLNSNRMRLSGGLHRCQGLLADWKQHGEESFEVKVLEVLPYDDRPGEDYSEDLLVLRQMWLESMPGSEEIP